MIEVAFGILVWFTAFMMAVVLIAVLCLYREHRKENA